MSQEKRKKKFKLRYEMYNDNYRDQVVTKLGAIYTSFVQLKLDVQLNDNNNLYKQVVNSISNVYSFGVEREFSNKDTQSLYQELQVNKVMTQANKYMNAFNDVIIQVSWNSSKAKPVLILRLPHQTEVDYYGNNGEVGAVRYFVGMVGKDYKTERWAYWSNNNHFYIDRLDSEETVVSISGLEFADFDNPEDWVKEIENPLGALPFVFLHNGWRDESFWDIHTGDDLIGGTIDTAVNLTFLNHLMKSQSFKQIVVTGSNVSKLSGQVLDPTVALTADGQDTNITTLDLEADYKQLHATISNISNNIAISYGISPNQFRLTSTASSGFALQMENLKLDKFTVEQQQDFTVYEQELFSVLKLVVVHYKPAMSEADTMTIDFVEPNYPTSPLDQLEIYKGKIQLGLTAPHKILMSSNPELTEETAIKEIEANLKASTNVVEANVKVNEATK